MEDIASKTTIKDTTIIKSKCEVPNKSTTESLNAITRKRKRTPVEVILASAVVKTVFSFFV